MGIVNVTPDSFSDGGEHHDVDAAVAHALALLDDGADILDIGGESTRPGAEPVALAVEQRRVLPVIEALVNRGVREISVDTRNASTAAAAHAAGASWLNDVGGLGGEGMLEVAARFDAVCIMHARGTPRDMQKGAIVYDDVVREVAAFLDARAAAAVAAGVDPERIVVDPGLGFGKRLEHNLALTRDLAALKGRAAGVLYGPSRKRFLGELTGIDVAKDRDRATVGAVTFAATRGADIVRVHDVKGAVEALRVVDALYRGDGASSVARLARLL